LTLFGWRPLLLAAKVRAPRIGPLGRSDEVRPGRIPGVFLGEARTVQASPS